MSKVKHPLKVAIIGGGPGGLSAARFCQDKGWKATVFERRSRVGGKSYSMIDGDAFFEMGTCYATRADRQVKAWMKETDISLTRLGEARFDGANIVDYVKSGGGGSLTAQLAAFVLKSRPLRRALKTGDDRQDVLDELSISTLDWVRKAKLPKIEKALHRVQTTNGYGYLDKTSIGQTLRWCSLDLILSGALNQVHMPDESWSEFWRRFATDLDVRLGEEVVGIERRVDDVVIHTHGTEQLFDAVINTAPMQVFCEIADATPEEVFIRDAVEWQNYTTSLFSSKNWFSGYKICGFSYGLVDSSRVGALIGARYECEDSDLGGYLYVSGQFSKDLSQPELAEILRSDAKRHGFDVHSIVHQETWEFFPQIRQEAVKNGVFNLMSKIQGQQRTWHGGSTFSHELVSSVVMQSDFLVKSMAKAQN